MHIKNAISVGLQVVEFFPVMESNAREMTAAVKDLVDGKKGHLTPDLQHQCQA
jgi:2-keto-3-deoxy-6-phosphogluconate aldolase